MISTLKNVDYHVTEKYARSKFHICTGFLKRRFKQVHFSRAHYLKFENKACFPCRNKNHTMWKLKRKISHFHCPVYKKTVRQKDEFQKHLSKHTDKITKNTNIKVDAISNIEQETDIKSLKEHLPSQFEDQKIGLLQQFTTEENSSDENEITKEITFQESNAPSVAWLYGKIT